MKAESFLKTTSEMRVSKGVLMSFKIRRLLKRFLFCTFAAVLLSGCGEIVNMKYWREMSFGSQIKPVAGPGFHPVIETDPLNAVVYVYRPFSDWAEQELQAPSFFIQNQRLFGLKNNMYVALELEPGRHKFSALRPLAILHVEKIFELELDVDPGEVYYMRYSEVSIPPELSFEEGFVSDGPFYQVSEEFARHEIRLTQSSDAKVQQVAKAARCDRNRDLMYGSGGNVQADQESGWSTNWRSYVEEGEDCK